MGELVLWFFPEEDDDDVHDPRQLEFAASVDLDDAAEEQPLRFRCSCGRRFKSGPALGGHRKYCNRN